MNNNQEHNDGAGQPVRCSAWLGDRDPATPAGVKLLAAERAEQLRSQAADRDALAAWLPAETPPSVCVFIFRALLAERKP